MLNFEQVKQLEAKIAKAIEYVEQITREKNALLQRETELKERLESYHRQETGMKTQLASYQSRIDELEVLVNRFKEDQGKIEEGILAALDRLNRFESDMDKSLKPRTDEAPGDKSPKAMTSQADKTAKAARGAAGAPKGEADPGASNPEGRKGAAGEANDPMLYAREGGEGGDDSQEKDGELEIY
jgi:chromosome segregation ATPase